MMPETWFTEFPVLTVDPRGGISRSASDTDDLIFFLLMTLKVLFVIRQFFYFRQYMSHNDPP